MKTTLHLPRFNHLGAPMTRIINLTVNKVSFHRQLKFVHFSPLPFSATSITMSFSLFWRRELWNVRAAEFLCQSNQSRIFKVWNTLYYFCFLWRWYFWTFSKSHGYLTVSWHWKNHYIYRTFCTCHRQMWTTSWQFETTTFCRFICVSFYFICHDRTCIYFYNCFNFI